MSESETTARTIERRLREAFRPERFELQDDSARHAGHAGNVTGGGHFRVTIVSEAFRGLSRVEQHRRVYAALGPLVGGAIHALALTTRTPDEASAD